jgi:hypothetical protein
VVYIITNTFCCCCLFESPTNFHLISLNDTRHPRILFFENQDTQEFGSSSIINPKPSGRIQDIKVIIIELSFPSYN